MTALAQLSPAPRPNRAARIEPPPVRLIESDAWSAAIPKISVLIAFSSQDPLPLLRALAEQRASEAFEIVLYDNGVANRETSDNVLDFVRQTPLAVRLVRAGIATGKAQVHNAHGRYGRADWFLMLEPEGAPTDTQLLERYLSHLQTDPTPALVIGGFAPSATPGNPRSALHHWHAVQFECLPATHRAKRPIRHLQTGNALFHKDILSNCRFDEMFKGHGWEGVDWGLRVARDFPVTHIDNPIVRTVFDTDFELLHRHRRAARNFARLVAWHPHSVGKSPLVRAALLMRRLPFRQVGIKMAGKTALSASLPLSIRRSAFKVWRALVYADAL